MSKVNHIPQKYSFWEKFKGFTYGILVFIAWILLLFSILFIVIYFFSFIIKKDIFNEEFIQLCIYVTIGAFSLIFIYDERCQHKFGLGNCKIKSKKK